MGENVEPIKEPGTVRRDIIVIGASAGGVETLGMVVSKLPAGLPAAVLIVLHLSPRGTSVLPAILARRGVLPAEFPSDGDLILPGVIYVAPPDRHLLIEGDHIRIGRGPSENGSRPAVDPLFRSAARSGRQRVIGVILSGMLDDGAAGMQVIHQLGGTTVVQDPKDALFAGMPRSAIETVPVDHIVPAAEIGSLLGRLVNEPLMPRRKESESGKMAEPNQRMDQESALQLEVGVALMKPGTTDIESRPGAVPSAYSCPECGGVLWEVTNEDRVRFRCRTGHAYSADSLLSEQSMALEDALWSALRALEESGSLARRLRDRAKERGNELMRVRYDQQADEATQRARRTLLHGNVFMGEPVGDDLDDGGGAEPVNEE